MIRSSQAKVGRTELAYRELGLFSSKAHGVKALNSRSNLCFSPSTTLKNARLRFSPMAVRSEPKEVSRRPKSVSVVSCLVSEKLDDEKIEGQVFVFLDL